jgi:hypothetical protein
MKFINITNSKFTKLRITLSVLIIFTLISLSISLKKQIKKTKAELEERADADIEIKKQTKINPNKSNLFQKELDNLIDLLEENKIKSSKIEIKNKNQQILKPKNKNLQDEVISAIKDLNKDFNEYDQILSENENEKNIIINSNIDIDIDNNNKEVEIYRNKISDSSKNYFKEISILTKNIDESFEAFDKFDKDKIQEKILKEKINHIKEIIKNVSELKQEINLIKNNKKLLEEKRQKIKNISNTLVNQYKIYLNMEKNTDRNIHKELKEIKNNIDLSFSFKNNFEDFLKIFSKLIDFQKKMNFGNEENLNKKLQKFKFYITALKNKDKVNLEMM